MLSDTVKDPSASPVSDRLEAPQRVLPMDL